MVSFDFYSTCYKVYIYLTYIKTQLHQGSDNCCEGDHNSDAIRPLQPYLKIHYFNQSVLAIVPDLNIFVWSITILISFREAPWYSTFLLSASYFYNSTVTKVLQFWFVNRLMSLWSPLSQVSVLYFYYEYMVLRSVRYRFVCIKIWLCHEFCFVLNCPMGQRLFTFSQILNLFIYCYFSSQHLNWYLITKKNWEVFSNTSLFVVIFSKR